MRTTLLFLCLSLAIAAQPAPTISAKTSGMQKLPGFFPLYWDDKTGKLFLEIDKFGVEVLYLESLPAGIGSNDIGLDRGQLGRGRIVRFERSGPKILLIEGNYRYRAVTADLFERRAADESFAQSVLWGFEAQAEEAGRVLVDATPFFLRDAHGISATLAQEKQGTFKVDASRSAVFLPQTKNFPKNTDAEVTLTFTGDNGGPWVRAVTPEPDAITVREHHSFIQLPDAGFKPREYDPRSGFFENAFGDYAAPLNARLEQRRIARHRLQKKDPNSAIGDPVQPIVYYLDRGAPEPIRSALLEGARWWNQAFEAAGYRNAFRVELLPEDADPMDIRYNMIQWIHRATRGWSYGASVVDPRTGEIIKGKVTLGSLRARQDYLIAEGLLAPYADGKTIPPDMERMVLARLRQLAAHEVGHTLGLAHNFAASVRDRASVMDYPPPLVKLNAAGDPDLSDAYAKGIGDWDKVSINFGYRDFPPGTDEASALDKILRQATDAGFLFLSDPDARPEGSAHPQNHLWDAGTNAVDELNRMLDVRARVLERFSERNIRAGAPMSSLEDVLVPAYLMHRYQTEAASKVLGGLFYTYALRGDGQTVTRPIPGQEQRRALDAVLRTIRADTLTLSPRVLALIPPRALGYPKTREDFKNRTGLTFDPIGAAESAANISIGLLLNSERATRLVQHHAEDPDSPSLSDVLDKLLAATWKMTPPAGLNGEVHRAVNSVTLYHLMALSANESASTQARAIAFEKLGALADWLNNQAQQAHFTFAAAQIKRFLANPREIPIPKPAEAPPGQPVGQVNYLRDDVLIGPGRSTINCYDC